MIFVKQKSDLVRRQLHPQPTLVPRVILKGYSFILNSLDVLNNIDDVL